MTAGAMYEYPYPGLAERVLNDIGTHTLAVVLDRGLHRHLRFRAPGCTYGEYWFDLVTWPGNLVINGDMGTYAFAREADMFAWFDPRNYGGRINPDYWGEKLKARSEPIKEFNPAKVREYIEDELLELAQDGWMGAAELTEIARAASKVIEWAPDEQELISGLMEVDHFADIWHADFSSFNDRYLWCCHAIVWGIAQYREGRG